MAKKRILLIEDENRIAKLVRKVLELENFEVDIVSDGKSGLLEAKKAKHDLIVLDYMLPSLNGLEICKELRLRELQTPIIMLTAKDTIEDRMAAANAGADAYLSKPFSFDQLSASVRSLLEQKSQKTNTNTQNEKYGMEINKKILDNIPASIVTIDRDGNMTHANKYFKNLAKQEDYRLTNVFTGPFFIRENLVKDYQALLQEGKAFTQDHCYERNVNGEDKYLKITAVPLLDENGNIEGALSIAQDNTEAVQLHKKLQLLNAELEKKVTERTKQLNEAKQEIEKILQLKSMFVADLSHEMRTALAIIQGNIELADRDLMQPEEKKETFELMLGEIKRMTAMLTDMALVSDSNSLKQNFNFEKINLNIVIADICKSLKSIAKEKNVKILHLKNRKKLEVFADRNQLEKLINNLVRNAIRYNNNNGKVEICAVCDKNKNVVLKVQDSGIGIAEENLPFIFERFYRVDKARSRMDGGSGLGLAICKWVAEIHGGKIEVESTLGAGSVFVVTLPIAGQFSLT